MTSTAARHSGRHTRDMTEGGIAKNLLLFALPLLLGNLFQQLYNMVDTWVIGQTGQSGAYAAVGSVGPITNIMIGIFSGFASGAGVVISRYFGAKEYGKVRAAVHTCALLTLFFSIVFTALGLLLAPTAVRLVLGEEGGDIYPHAVTYITIYFSGLAGLLIYNMGAGILRAVGDSRHPFYFLVAAACTNIVLDLLFVFGFGMGVAGVAYATIIAQGLSALLTVITLLRTESCVKITLHEMRIDKPILGQIVRLGIPAALQLAITAFSNVFVQGYIAGVNADKTAALGGWTTYSKLDAFLFLPSQSLSLALSTFVSQNLGAGKGRRALAGVARGIGMALLITAPLIVLVMLLASPLAGIFNPDPAVVYYATLLLRYITPFYILTCFNQLLAATLRGAGNTTAPMVIMLSSLVGFRQLYLFLMSTYISNDLIPVAMSYPAGWLLCCLVITTYSLVFLRRLTKESVAE